MIRAEAAVECGLEQAFAWQHLRMRAWASPYPRRQLPSPCRHSSWVVAGAFVVVAVVASEGETEDEVEPACPCRPAFASWVAVEEQPFEASRQAVNGRAFQGSGSVVGGLSWGTAAFAAYLAEVPMAACHMVCRMDS